MPKSFHITNTFEEDFDRSFFGTATAVSGAIGSPNDYTIAGWWKTGSISDQVIFGTLGDDNYTQIQINTFLNEYQVILTGEGSTFKLYRYDSQFILDTDTWYFAAVSWNGSSLKTWHNSYVRTDANKLIDDSGTQTDEGLRRICNASPSSGFTGPMAIWDTELDGNALNVLWNPPGGVPPFDFDWTTDSGSYTQSANLIHYYRPSSLDVFGHIDRVGSSNLTGGTTPSTDTPA